MDRLRDEGSQVDAVVDEAAKLVRSVSLPDPPVGMQQRIRARLTSPKRPKRRSGAWRLQPAVVVVILVALVAVSGAAAVRIWRQHQVAISAGAGQRAERTTQHPQGVQMAPPAPVIPPAELPPAPVLQAVPEPKVEGPIARTAVRHRPREESHPEAVPLDEAIPQAATNEIPEPAAPAKETPAPSPVVVANPEAILVLNATRALHHDHDATRALKLLAEYLRRFPAGNLLEESMALAIEAKSMRNDAEAASLASEYLRRFPSGRFRVAALRAQHRFAK